MKWFAFDRINGDFELCDTEEAARKIATEWLTLYKDQSSDEGWPEDMEGNVGYGPIQFSTKYTILEDRKDYTDEEWADECYPDQFSHIAKCDLVGR